MMNKFKTITLTLAALCFLFSGVISPALAQDADAAKAYAAGAAEAKKNPDKAVEFLKQGNERFVSGKTIHPNITPERLKQAGTENQGDHAYATVITCSDSRVPVELLFDAGIMDIFVIRVAGNVCDTDEVGSIEYGLAHVNTPVLVVLGHTQCGAVTAVTHAVNGTGHALERNIPPLVDNIKPAVERAIKANPMKLGDAVIPAAIEENVWQGIEDLFMASPATRELVKKGKAKVVGAIYDVGTGKIAWLPMDKPGEILKKVEANPKRAMNAMAGKGHDKHDGKHGDKHHDHKPGDKMHDGKGHDHDGHAGHDHGHHGDEQGKHDAHSNADKQNDGKEQTTQNKAHISKIDKTNSASTDGSGKHLPYAIALARLFF